MGGIVILVDAVLMMQFGVDGVFVGFGIFKSKNFEKRVRVIVMVIIYYNDLKILVEILYDFGEEMEGIDLRIFLEYEFL